MEIVAIAGANEQNKDSLVSILESYREMLFPGVSDGKQEESDEDRAKRALAEESKKVYLVSSYDKVTDETWRNLASKGGDAAFIARRQLRESQEFKSRLAAKPRSPIPKGTTKREG